jgi:hypothetical protein
MIAAISATLIGTRHRSRILRRSGSNDAESAPLNLRTTMSTRSKWYVPRGRVRPPVTMYGRETGPASSYVRLSSSELMAVAYPGTGSWRADLRRAIMCCPTRLTRTAIS